MMGAQTNTYNTLWLLTGRNMIPARLASDVELPLNCDGGLEHSSMLHRCAKSFQKLMAYASPETRLAGHVAIAA